MENNLSLALRDQMVGRSVVFLLKDILSLTEMCNIVHKGCVEIYLNHLFTGYNIKQLPGGLN